jgi:hypothetical protein
MVRRVRGVRNCKKKRVSAVSWAGDVAQRALHCVTYCTVPYGTSTVHSGRERGSFFREKDILLGRQGWESRGDLLFPSSYIYIFTQKKLRRNFPKNREKEKDDASSM